MKKILLVLFLCLGVSMGMDAKTIHWLTFIDTTDRNVGEIDKSSRQLLYSRWIDLVNTTLKERLFCKHRLTFTTARQHQKIAKPLLMV